MKVRRYKRVQRLVSFYRNNFGFAPPFRVIVDGTFCRAALENKINLREQLPRYLGEEVRIATTPCVLAELTALGDALYGALHVARQLEPQRCAHRPKRPAARCLAAVQRRAAAAGRPVFIGTQDRDLTERLRAVAGCPVLFIRFNALLLEKPQQQSVDAANAQVDARLNFEGPQEERLRDMKRRLLPKRRRERDDDAAPRRAKGPNPLSCKTKQKAKPASSNKASGAPPSKTARKRKRKKAATTESD